MNLAATHMHAAGAGKSSRRNQHAAAVRTAHDGLRRVDAEQRVGVSPTHRSPVLSAINRCLGAFRAGSSRKAHGSLRTLSMGLVGKSVGCDSFRLVHCSCVRPSPCTRLALTASGRAPETWLCTSDIRPLAPRCLMHDGTMRRPRRAQMYGCLI